ncbi:MAG: flavodoxin-dependent (E)-4-hydroxy-3-methylbut-2-enyl-diphosphate synthase [Kiritimatiellae bacterium]|nr:flavodoxin-dependent (E)-4-hydroxy-3-methylbut-2-enyl-diphosphate synthase [Kiritimatiellia bacterium]
MFTRTQTRALKVGSLPMGGGAPVSVQTMGTADPHDAKACLAQLVSCAERGCDLFRMAVPDVEAAETLGEVRRSSPIPIVADVHFDYRCALAALAAGADALRLNPGNIGGRDRVQAVARAAKEKGAPVRIGVNGGSLEPGETPVGSALKHLRLLEGEGLRDIVLSVKLSDARKTVAAYRELAECTDCPLHLGVTEAGTLIPGTVRSSVALGILLDDGIGDTVRVSLTGKPEKEVKVAQEILRALGLRAQGPAITSCPTCGRTRVDLVRVASQVEDALETLALDGRPVPKVAVMGCAVNGPGEAKGADIALCGGEGEFLLYVRGRLVEKVSEDEAVRKVVEHVVSCQ